MDEIYADLDTLRACRCGECLVTYLAYCGLLAAFSVPHRRPVGLALTPFLVALN